MAQAANIVLADALATPVNHTFIPIGQDSKGIFWWEDQSQVSAAGFWRISMKLDRPTPAKAGVPTTGRNYRCTVVLSEPILEVVSNSTVLGIAPAPTISYIPRSELSFVLPERSSLASRKDLRKMSALLLADTQIVAAIENLVAVY